MTIRQIPIERTSLVVLAIQVMKLDGQQVISLLRRIDGRLCSIAQAVAASTPDAINPQQSYTRTQAARLLAVSTWSIDKGRKEGLLIEARRIGQRDVRITGESLMACMKKKETASVRVRRM